MLQTCSEHWQSKEQFEGKVYVVSKSSQNAPLVVVAETSGQLATCGAVWFVFYAVYDS